MEMSHKREMERLWRICFNDDEDFINFFFTDLYHAVTPFLHIENSELASMLFTIPIEIISGERCCKGHYVYGACTLPQYRRRGFMASLLARAAEDASLRGDQFSLLIPATGRLFSYYKSMGYTQTARGYFPRNIVLTEEGRRVEPEEYFSARSCHLADIPHGVFPNEISALVRSRLQNEGYYCEKTAEGYCLCKDFPNGKHCIETIPFGEQDRADYCVLRPLQGQAPNFSDCYFNLLFDWK